MKYLLLNTNTLFPIGHLRVTEPILHSAGTETRSFGAWVYQHQKKDVCPAPTQHISPRAALRRPQHCVRTHKRALGDSFISLPILGTVSETVRVIQTESTMVGQRNLFWSSIMVVLVE